MAETPHQMAKMAPAKSAINLRPLPRFTGFPDKIKQISPEMQKVESELHALFRELESRITELSRHVRDS